MNSARYRLLARKARRPLNPFGLYYKDTNNGTEVFFGSEYLLQLEIDGNKREIEYRKQEEEREEMFNSLCGTIVTKVTTEVNAGYDVLVVHFSNGLKVWGMDGEYGGDALVIERE